MGVEGGEKTAHPAGVPSGGGMRERVRQATIEELEATALRLFTERGFEQTTVADIVAAVGVSQRTFFRYFATKEDVIMRWSDDLSPIFVERLRGRPASESPVTAVRRCFDAMYDPESRLEQAMFVARLMASSPTLQARIVQRQVVWEQALAVVLAERMGVDAELDLRPQSVVAAVLSAMRVTSLRLIEQGRPVGDHAAMFDQACSALEGHGSF
jgi:AcrR family transcriptional regulator